MQVWVTAPTDREIHPLISWLQSISQPTDGQKYRFRGHDIVIKTTGVGAVATVFHLSRALQETMPDCVLQIGLAGSYAAELSPGTVVRVQRDRLADLGAEDHDRFLDVFTLGLDAADAFPFQQGWLVNPYLQAFPELILPAVQAITVQTVSGSASTIARRAAGYHPQIETMEGAAFHYVCLQMHVPFLQIRAISNYVEPRDKSKWRISTAIENLHQVMKQWLDAWLR
jgi:futalosine hydrolase